MRLFRKIFTAAAAVLAALLVALPASAAEAPSVSAQAAVLYDPLSGAVLYEKNGGEVLPMASTTKIMTALLAFDSGQADAVVEVTPEMVAVEGSSMGLAAGNRLTLGSIARGMMMASGNDGANAIALFLGGSAEGFASLMNARAAEIGMENTRFVTPSGLDAEGHGTTAYDMALLGAEAMRCADFAETVGAVSQTVEFLSPEKTVRYDNHNRLLQLYSDCTGVKTGFTKKAGRCLVSSAERGGAQLICVTLNAPDDWNDHIALFEYGFSQLETRAITPDGTLYAVPVVGGAASSVVCRAEGKASATLYRDAALTASVSLPRFVYAPLEAGAQVGCVTYSVNGSVVAELPIVAAADVQPAEDTRSDFQKWLDRLRRPA